jgi:hypothetical protein
MPALSGDEMPGQPGALDPDIRYRIDLEKRAPRERADGEQTL